MKSFEDWFVFIFGGFVATSTAVAKHLDGRTREVENKLDTHAESISELKADRTNMKESLERIESKLDRVIEREHGA